MSKGVKLFLAFIVVFFSMIFSLSVAVNERINPEEISKFVKTTFKSFAPNTQVSVGKVDYSMGTMVRIYINEIGVTKNNNQLLAIKKIVLKIPLLSTVFGNGTIKIKIEKPEVDKTFQNFLTFNEKSKVSIEVPSFILKNKLDLNMHNIAIKNKNKEVLLNKVLVKNLSLNKSMAYELVGNIKLHLGTTNIDGTAQVIGEVNLNKLRDIKDIKSNLMIDIKNLKTQKGKTLPRGRGKFDVVWNTKTKELTGKGNLNIDTVMDSEFDFLTNFQTLNISSLQASVVNDELPKVLEGQLFKYFDYQKSITLIQGHINYDFLTGNFDPQLDLDLKKPIKYLSNGIPLQFTLTAKIKDKIIEAKIIKEILKGVVTSNIKMELVGNPFDFNRPNIKKITGNVLATGIELDRSFFALISQGEKKVKKKVKEIDFNKKKPKKTPFVTLTFDGKNNFIGKSKIDMQGIVKFHNDTFSLEHINATTRTGSVALDLVHNDLKTSFSLKAKNIELKDFSPVLPVLTPNLTGQLSLSVKGFQAKRKYRYNIQMNIQNFLVGLVNLSSSVNSFLEEIGQKQIFLDDEKLNSFDLVNANFIIHDQGLKIKKSEIYSQKLIIKIRKGEISRKGKSIVLGSIKTKRIIPFKYVGRGHTLNPDIEYTKKFIRKKEKYE